MLIERPYFALPTPPQDMDALMAADRAIVDGHPGLTVYYRRLFVADGPEGRLSYGDKPLSRAAARRLQADWFKSVRACNAVRVTVISAEQGIRARQPYALAGFDLAQDGVVMETLEHEDL